MNEARLKRLQTAWFPLCDSLAKATQRDRKQFGSCQGLEWDLGAGDLLLGFTIKENEKMWEDNAIILYVVCGNGYTIDYGKTCRTH